MAFSAFALSCLAWASGSRMRKNVKESSSSSSCESLMSLDVRGHKFGDVASTVCSAWPSSFGEFPINRSGANRLLHLALYEGGMYDDIKTMSNKGWSRHNYCAKDFAWKSQDGVCPPRMKSFARIKIFPGCSSDCSATRDHTQTCGMQCASSKQTCAELKARLYGSVVTGVAWVVADTMKNLTKALADKLVKIIPQAARFAEFVLTVVRDVVAKYKEYQPRLDMKSAVAVSLILLFQYSGENRAGAAGQDSRGFWMDKFKDALREVAKTVLKTAWKVITTVDDFMIFMKKFVAKPDPEFLENMDMVMKPFLFFGC